ncbi:MAG: glycosyltransferase involved in cell wall biosynthesis [Arenicella sp.]|jgi:glycosyltransferase involved in cell wall biosynthesis
MKPIIYNLNNIRPPLTGVGRYSIELIRETLVQRPNIIVAKNGKLHIGNNLELQINSFDSVMVEQTAAPNVSRSQRSRNLRAMVGNIPFSRTLFQTLDRYQFAQLRKLPMANGSAYHDLNYSLSPESANNVSTVYDLSNVICPETHPKHRIDNLNAYFNKLKIGACQIIAISHSTKSELMEHYGIAENRIGVTHLAADKNFHPRGENECQGSLSARNLNYKKYVLCVGTMEPRKNLSTILTAYEALDPQLQQEYPLVMAGPFGWKSTELEDRINCLHKSGVVRQLGFVQQSELPTLYAGAAVFVYPSLYEGFGLPLLEAMQSGCPCVTSNIGALAEVSAECALQVDPRKSDDVAEQLIRLLSDPKLNLDYANLGQQRAKSFSWTKTASQTCDIYDSL